MAAAPQNLGYQDTLGILLHAIAEYRDAQDSLSGETTFATEQEASEVMTDAAETAIEAADSLISWLADGGFAPDWSKAVADALDPIQP